MPKLALFSRGSHFMNGSRLSGITVSDWSVLNTGLSAAHTIGRPTRFTVGAGYTHFALTGGTQNILRLDRNSNTFSSSSSAVNTGLSPNPTVATYTDLCNVTSNSNIYGVFNGVYSSLPMDYVLSGTDGFSYASSKGSASNSDALVGLFTTSSIFFTASKKGYFYTVANGGSLSSTYTGANAGFNSSADCRCAITDGTNYIIAGGSGAAAKVYSIPIASLSSPGAAWNNVANSFGQPIAKLGYANVYTSWTQNIPNVFLVNASSRVSVILAGGTNGKIGYSLDGGSTWTIPASQPFITGDTITGFVAGQVNIFAVTNTGKIARSMDAGVTWTLINIGVSIGSLSFAEIAGSQYFIGGANAFLAIRDVESVSTA